MMASGLVWLLWVLKASHLDRSLVIVTSVAISSLVLTLTSVAQIPWTVT